MTSLRCTENQTRVCVCVSGCVSGCVWVCVYVCMCVCMCLCVHMCVCVYMSVSVSMCVSGCVYTCVRVCVKGFLDSSQSHKTFKVKPAHALVSEKQRPLTSSRPPSRPPSDTQHRDRREPLLKARPPSDAAGPPADHSTAMSATPTGRAAEAHAPRRARRPRPRPGLSSCRQVEPAPAAPGARCVGGRTPGPAPPTPFLPVSRRFPSGRTFPPPYAPANILIQFKGHVLFKLTEPSPVLTGGPPRPTPCRRRGAKPVD